MNPTMETATILTSCRLLNADRVPGDRLTSDELADLAPHSRQALVSQGLIAIYPAGKAPAKRAQTAAERRAALGVTKAEKAVENAREMLDTVRAKYLAATAQAQALADERRKLALPAASGDDEAAEKGEALRAEQATVDLEVADLASAVEQAQDEVASASADVESAEMARRHAEAVKYIDTRIKVAKRITAAVAELAPQVNEYVRLGAQIRSASRDDSTHLQSRWRLDALLNHALGTAYVEAAYRERTFVQHEQSLLAQVAARLKGQGDG